ncbi:prepilin-type N-terminal cleavage/methylation domain-containing protein [Opitutus sp. GAS368]|jgi:general secretion pathway protein G|uniref:prepilin-type N-terminal cleavage/methylation domain-containing protein n=1 Tax=Opitutus sp. GAS368 TaxID=1882749 RepID=UPI00087DB996|nr:prepilin-type N-terminal cleavage/methylation domain-containing protein [Opitutus sp. GAS368]SDS61313.1 prepilin-type N-terminal cleavage/methylation domain-containing protein [Opitutus sp. GAS368]
MDSRRPSGQSRRGFTLLELLAVITLIAILAGIVIGVGRRASEAGKTARAKAELAALSAALETYKRIYGDYPRILSDSLSTDTASGQALYAALNGQRGPQLGATDFPAQQRVLLEKSRFTLTSPTAADNAVNAVLDPWGNPYRYAYNPGASWKNSSFVLLSAGPDGNVTLPIPSDGLISAAYEATQLDGRPLNLDNLYANR